MAVGVNGPYVVVLNSGCIWSQYLVRWSGVPESPGQLLNNARRTGRAVVVSVMTLSINQGYLD